MQMNVPVLPMPSLYFAWDKMTLCDCAFIVTAYLQTTVMAWFPVPICVLMRISMSFRTDAVAGAVVGLCHWV